MCPRKCSTVICRVGRKRGRCRREQATVRPNAGSALSRLINLRNRHIGAWLLFTGCTGRYKLFVIVMHDELSLGIGATSSIEPVNGHKGYGRGKEEGVVHTATEDRDPLPARLVLLALPLFMPLGLLGSAR